MRWLNWWRSGLVNSDSFAGLRVLLMPSGRRGEPRNSYSGRHKRRLALFGMADAGRWALLRRPGAQSPEREDEAVEQIVRTLLRRWGVIFWKLLAREAEWLPPWRDILMLLPPTGGARRNSRRPFRRRIFRRAIRDARGHRLAARCAPQAASAATTYRCRPPIR